MIKQKNKKNKTFPEDDFCRRFMKAARRERRCAVEVVLNPEKGCKAQCQAF